MSIIPDPILALVQVVPFLVLMLGLHLILFKPMLAYLSAREEATAGAKKSAESLAAQSEARLREYETALAKAQAEVTEYRAARRAEAQKDYQARVAAARSAVDAKLGAAMTRITTEARDARSGIKDEAQALARDVANQVLGRQVEA